MEHPFADGFCAGLAGIDLRGATYEFGHGIMLRPTYAHLIGAFMVAFSPAPPGKHHPAPWKAARTGGFGADVVAELEIPASTLALSPDDRLELMEVILAMLRLWVTPTVTVPIVSNIPFASAKDAPDNKAYLWPYESRGFETPLHARLEPIVPDTFNWIRDHWQNVFALSRSSTPFNLALLALDRTQSIKEHTLTLISYWAALEGLFLTETQELTFRLAVLIASYLEEPGPARIERSRQIRKLYGHRSKAAHGKPKNDPAAFGESFALLREVIVRIVEANHVPTQEELEQRLLGS